MLVYILLLPSVDSLKILINGDPTLSGALMMFGGVNTLDLATPSEIQQLHALFTASINPAIFTTTTTTTGKKFIACNMSST